MRTGSAFGGPGFWAALRETGVEKEVRSLYLDAKLTLRRKGGLPMQVCYCCNIGFAHLPRDLVGVL